MEDRPSLLDTIRAMDRRGAADFLAARDDAEIAQLLIELGPPHAVEVLEEYALERRARIAATTPIAAHGQHWLRELSFPEGTVGRLMERAPAVFPPGTPISAVIEALREVVRHTLITYIFVADQGDRLVGVVAFRELVFARPEQTLAEVMVIDPFSLRPEAELVDAMREVVTRHYPAYPVCDANGVLLGMVRGQILFEQQAFEISAQAGSMVGVEKEERIATPWARSLRFRHPWLQLNLLTAFVAAAVVGVFQGAIDRIVLLAVFLPVLSGQCSNTGCQALAVTLRGMTLGEMRGRRPATLIAKEAWLGLLNGALVGVVAAVAMYVLARMQSHPSALLLALITFIAMAGSCVLSGMAGAAVPLALKRMGADPATASSIFLTTATDVVSMGLFLGMATWLIY